MANLVFGTSGWSYKEWVGPFYDETAKMFSYYARFFNTAEINSTFYRYPSKATVYGLNRTSPKEFIFSTKLPKLITHEKRLDPDLKIKSDLVQFLELLDPLKASGKLGCTLIQLPPSFVYERDHENLEAFLNMLPDDYEFAAEFRDHSWMSEDTWKMLKEHNVAYCIVDEPLLPPEVHVTADFAYFRWHGRGARPWYDYHYSEKELREWVPRIEKVRDKVSKVYGYFNNHYHGYAPENCIEILEMLNIALPEQTRVKKKIVRHNLEKRPSAYQRRLDKYRVSPTGLSAEALLLKVTDEARLERGREIGDDELSIEEATDEHIYASIRDYFIDIDLSEKTIVHNCDDWRKGLGIKRMCKHLCKLFMALPEEQALRIVRGIIEDKDGWVFKTQMSG